MSMKEKDLYGRIKNSGPFAKKQFYYEIPIGDWVASRKRIDLVTIKKKELVSIEVKISNWRKALQQAYANLYVFDYSYVALWHQTIHNVDKTIFEKLGIGILEVNISCEEILKAEKSNRVISKCKTYAKNKCKSKKGEQR